MSESTFMKEIRTKEVPPDNESTMCHEGINTRTYAYLARAHTHTLAVTLKIKSATPNVKQNSIKKTKTQSVPKTAI